MINHRYKILRKLGEGGSGEVYLVEDTLREKRRVAMKVLRASDQTGGDDEQSFRAEVSTLLQLNHPNLIQVFDYGMIRKVDRTDLGNRRYYTMEFIEGTDALAWCGTISEPQSKARLLESLLLQSLSVLFYIHREGIIHYDIKPQNLMLVGVQGHDVIPVLKLTDFGFSVRGRTPSELPLRGTLEYAAPELLQGEPADHRVDLYSLGASFYHLVEGRCPFEAAEPVELIKMALTQEVSFVRAAHPAYDHLRRAIGLLMARNPAERCQTAKEAGEILAADTRDLMRLYFGFLSVPRFVGRKNEKEMIMSALCRMGKGVDAGGPASISVCGSEGIGKSALLRECVKRARSEGLPVYEAGPAGSHVPFSALKTALALLQADAQSHSVGGEALVERYRPLLEKPLEWDRETLIELHARFVAQCSTLFSFVLVADDAYLLDAETLEVLRVVARDAQPGHFLLLSSEEGEKARSFSPPGGAEVRLVELTSTEVADMTSSMFGQGRASEELGARIYELYGGMPELIAEALQAVGETLPTVLLDQEIAPVAALSALEDRLPASLDEFMMRKLGTLTAERQHLLSLLSCFQRAARVDVLAALEACGAAETLDDLRFLEFEGYLRKQHNGERFALRLRRLKATMYASIGENPARFHMMIARAMEQVHPLLSFEDRQELAHHFALAGDAPRAARYLEQAADEGMRLSAYQRSANLYRDALNAAPRSGDARTAASLTMKLANALLQAGEYHDAIDVSNTLLSGHDTERVLTAETESRLRKLIGLAQSQIGEYEPAKRNMLYALEHTADQAEQAELRQELVGVEIALGNYADAETMCRAQREQAVKLSNDRLLATVDTDLGIATFYQERFDDALGFFEESMRLYSALGQQTRVTGAMVNLGNVMSAKGNLPKAIDYWDNALQSSKQYGTLNQQARILNNLGIAHYNSKSYEKAKEYYAQARELFQRIGSKEGLAYTLTNFGEVSFAEGEYEPALRQWSEANELYASMEDVHGLAETYLQLSQLYHLFGDMRAMDGMLREAEKLIDSKRLETFRAQLLRAQGLLLSSMGQRGSALRNLEEAAQRFNAEGKVEYGWQCALDRAMCLFHDGKADLAGEAVALVLKAPDIHLHPQIMAKGYLILGEIARDYPSAVSDKSLSYLKRGMDLLENEPVSELTWKVSFALAREFHERGQNTRAREFLHRAEAVINFLLSHFTTLETKNQYLRVDQKEKVLSTIETMTRS